MDPRIPALKSRRGLLAAGAALLLAGTLALAWPALQRAGAALLAVCELAGHPMPAWLDHRPAPASETLEIAGVGGPLRFDRLGSAAQSRAALVLLHGLTAQGKDDPRLQTFGRQLARAGFLVLAPDLASLRAQQLGPRTVAEVRDALGLLGPQRSGTRSGRLGVAAISVAAGPALIASADLAPQDGPDFALAIGPYHDLRRILRYQLTGTYDHRGTRVQLEPGDAARWSFLLSQLGQVADPADQRRLRDLARHRLGLGPEPGGAAPPPGPAGRAVLAFVENTDPQRFDALFAALPAGVRDAVDELDLAGRPLGQLRLSTLLVHGRNDPVIPFPESLELAAALAPGQARVFLIPGLQHVAEEPGLVDLWGLWRAVYALLALGDSV